MAYKQEAEESLDDFVNRCRRMTQRCSITEHEQQQRIIELIIASTPIADFQKELLRKDKTLTLEETVSTGKTYEGSNIHIKQLRAMVNNNNVDNTNIEAIRTPTRSTMSNNCLILTFNCINMTQRDEAFVLINIKLPNRDGIHELRLKIDTGAQGNTLPVSTFRRISPEKFDADGFPNIKRNNL